MNILKKIFGIILNILMVIVFIIMLIVGYAFIQVNILNKDYANIFGYAFFQIKTGSMEDTLKIGDIIINKVIDSEDTINVEDIISYKEEDYIITHRVIEINGDEIITQGDANNTPDEPIKREQVIGKLEKVLPDVSIWVDVFKTKEVYISVIVTIVLFIITFSISTDDSKKESKKMIERREKKKKYEEELSKKAEEKNMEEDDSEEKK